MRDSPCIACTAPCTDEDMCETWRLWFGKRWERARFNLGAPPLPPPAGKSGRLPQYIYEVREASDGTLICRGTISDCADEMGISVNSIDSAWRRGGLARKRFRVTRLEIGDGCNEN